MKSNEHEGISEERLRRLIDCYRGRFGEPKNLYVARAPGRANLIGEHTDYNDGYVLPMAIERDMCFLGEASGGRTVSLYSVQMDDACEFELDRIERSEEHAWANYVMGVAQALQQEGFALGGARLVLDGNVPIGSGLSSSAALDVAAAFALLGVSGHEEATRDPSGARSIAVLSQRSDNEFVGVRCGIMDQFVSAMAEAECALFIDCRSLEYKSVPIPSETARVIIADTGVRRPLAGSAYNERRATCERAVEKIRGVLAGVRALRDVSVEDLSRVEGVLDEVEAKRARHVVEENARVLEAVEALDAGDVEKFGRLMRASHESLDRLYEVTSEELNCLVEAALSVEGVYGARMTGAGFGGCIVVLARPDAVERATEAMTSRYERAFGKTAAVYVSGAAAGAWVGRVEGR